MELLEEIPDQEWRYSVPEFRLLREPTDLKELLDALLTQKCLIWLAERELFITYRDAIWNHVADFLSWSFNVCRKEWICNHTFRLYAKTHNAVEDSFLFRLRDDYFHDLLFFHNEFPNAQLPFSASFIGVILAHNPNRCHEFREFVFSPKHSAVMVQQATPVQLFLSDCEMTDSGKHFYKLFQDRVGLFGSLSLRGLLPIRGKYFLSLLTHLGQNLALLNILSIECATVSLLDCPLLAQINVYKLCLQHCVLEDDGDSLIRAISSGATIFTSFSIDSILGTNHGSRFPGSRNQISESMLLAVGDERCTIKHLRVGNPSFDVPVSLVDALQKNQNIESLCLGNPNIQVMYWIRNLEHMWNFDPHKLVYLKKMLDVNHRLEVSIYRYGSMQQNCQDKWEEIIAPKLCFNRFHRGIIELGSLADESKVKLFGAALICHQSDQKQIALHLKCYADILVSLLQTQYDT